MRPLAVVFDLDDTLYPESQFVRSGFAAAGALAEAEGIEGFERRAMALFEQGVRGTIVDRVLAELAPGRAAALVPLLIAAYREHRPRISLYADAAALLAELRGRLPVGLISDGIERTQRGKLDALGIAALFDRIILTDALGGRTFWKPNLAAFEDMVASLPAYRHIYIGDNPAKDFVAPNALGWLTVCVRRPDGEYRDAGAPAGGAAQHEIATLAEVPTLLGL